MIKIEIDISQIKNEISQIHNDLHETYNMTDTQRRDAVNRIVEKTRTLKTLLDSRQLLATVK
jgi:hypothetical protein